MLRSLALYTALVFAANAAAAQVVWEGGAVTPQGGSVEGQAAPAASPAANAPAADSSVSSVASSAAVPPSEAATATDTAAPPQAAPADAPAADTTDAASSQAASPSNAPAASATTATDTSSAAQTVGSPDFEAARTAGLSKLVETTPPAPVPTVAFSDLDGGTHSLADWQGKVLLVNFWATWCAPCRDEMPSLDALQKARGGGDDFAVLTIAAGRNPPAAITKFFTEENITDLPTLTDERTELARAFGVMAMPVTILIDAEGREVARMTGDADWASPAAMALVDQLRGQ